MAMYMLTTLPDTVRSWFGKIRELCYMYGLPHPLALLQEHPDKEAFKLKIKLNVHEY